MKQHARVRNFLNVFVAHFASVARMYEPCYKQEYFILLRVKKCPTRGDVGPLAARLHEERSNERMLSFEFRRDPPCAGHIGCFP